ncbi:MAG: hypothetical protein JW893_08405 [Candidatus Omnitrophica bacterium]|nr:hypothetical protein [Candidatus Omnitrophota bacterium]
MTQIRAMAFVFTGEGAQSVRIDWGNFDFIEPIDPDSSMNENDITKLPLLSNGHEPTINGFASQDQDEQPTADVEVTVMTEALVQVTYSGDAETSFGGAYINYDDGGTTEVETIDLTSEFPAGIVLGVSSPNVDNVIFEVTDIDGKQSKVRLRNLTSDNQMYVITADKFFGVDVTQIKSMAFVMSGTEAQVISILWGDYEYTPAVDGDAFNASLHTVLPNSPRVSATGGNSIPTRLPGFITLTQNSESSFEYVYDLNSSATAFVFSQILFDRGLASLPEEITFGLEGPEGTQLKVEIVDNDGDKAIFLLNLTGNPQNYTLDLTGTNMPPTFDRSQVFSITFVNDRLLAGSALRDTIMVYTAGLDYKPVLQGDAYNAGVHTALPNGPSVSATGSNVNPMRLPGFVTLTPISSSAFDYVYDLNGSPSAFVFSQINFGDSPAALPEELTVGINGPAGAFMKVEIIDNTGAKLEYTLRMAGELRNYTFDLSGGEIDRNHVTFINFVHDQNLSRGVTRGTVQIRTQGLTVVPILTGEAWNPALHTYLPDQPTISATGANVSPNRIPGFVTIQSQTDREIQYVYDLGGSPTSFVFTQIFFSKSVGSLPEQFVLGIQGPNQSMIKVEVVDNYGNVAIFLVRMTGDLQNYTFDLAGGNVPTGFDREDIAFINFVTDRDLASGYPRGNILIQTRGLDYTPVLDGVAFNEDALTVHTGTPTVTAEGLNMVFGRLPAGVTLEQESADEFSYAYSLVPSETSLVRTTLKYQTPQTLPAELVMALRGGEGSQVKVEVYDVNGATATFLLNLRAVYQNYSLSLSNGHVPQGFDRTQIDRIELIHVRDISNDQYMDVVKVKTKGLHYEESIILSPELEALKETLIDEGHLYFTQAAAIDPTTHFPYDRMYSDGSTTDGFKFTQPVLIGFYLQMLSDVVIQKSNWDGMTVSGALAEINTVVNNLLSVQADHGWNGLIPWLDLADEAGQPRIDPADWVGIGDSASLAQSLAVMIGALESAGLTTAQRIIANSIVNRSDQLLDNMQPGFEAFVDDQTGLFRGDVDTTNDDFDYYIDRFATEFRGPIAFLLARYPTLPDTVWDNLEVFTGEYVDYRGRSIDNLTTYEGGAFQIFWPMLRNDERDFIGLRNILYNQFAIQADYARQNRIPGFESASDIPSWGHYVGLVGVPQIAETDNPIIMDVGSTYSLAAAYLVDPVATMTWLKAIYDQVPALDGPYGLIDSARSNTEIANRYFGIDIASIILGLTGAGPDSFETYMRNRGLELDFNLLYDRAAKLGINKTDGITTPPEFPDRTLAVFHNVESDWTLNNFPSVPADEYGVRMVYGDLSSRGGWGGQIWNLDQVYDAQANKLLIFYSYKDSPQEIKIELKTAGDELLYETVVHFEEGDGVHKAEIDLPNITDLQEVNRVIVIVDQNATGDRSGDFRIHAMDFQHLPSSQNISSKAGLTAGTFNIAGDIDAINLISSNPPTTGSMSQINPSTVRLTYNVTQPNYFAGVSVDFGPGGKDFSDISKAVLGLQSSTVSKVKLEVVDTAGNRAVFYLTNVSSTRRYYEFLASSRLNGSIDLTSVQYMNFVVDPTLVLPTGQTGSLTVELGEFSNS